MTVVITPQVVAGAEQDASVDRLVVRPMLPEDLPAVLSMLERCSRKTLYHRFHGYDAGARYVAGLFRRPDDLLLIAERRSCVGFAVLASDGEMGVLVEDGWQRRGVGRALVVEVMARARERGYRMVTAEVLAEDAVYVRLLGRAGEVRHQVSRGIIRAEVRLG